MLLVLNLPFQLETLVPIAFCGGVLIGISMPNQMAIILNVNAPSTRGTATAVFGMTDEIGEESSASAPLHVQTIARHTHTHTHTHTVTLSLTHTKSTH